MGMERVDMKDSEEVICIALGCSLNIEEKRKENVEIVLKF